MGSLENKKSISPGSIGGKIKKYRELRGWSQKELGIKCGFSTSTADVRIGQYERNKKTPREKVLNNLATALGIDVDAFFDADMLVYNRMYHALFDMEDFHGLHPVKKADGYYLEFSGKTIFNQNITKQDFQEFLSEWYKARQKYMSSDIDTDDATEKKAREYDLWRGQYPFKAENEIYEKMKNRIKMNQLQAEMDALKEKMKQYDTNN